MSLKENDNAEINFYDTAMVAADARDWASVKAIIEMCDTGTAREILKDFTIEQALEYSRATEAVESPITHVPITDFLGGGWKDELK